MSFADLELECPSTEIYRPAILIFYFSLPVHSTCVLPFPTLLVYQKTFFSLSYFLFDSPSITENNLFSSFLSIERVDLLAVDRIWFSLFGWNILLDAGANEIRFQIE